jgi:signal transduction histidine kinase
MVPWRDEALARGFRSSAAFPITVENRLIGAFTVYAPDEGTFDAESIGLLNEVVAELSFALMNLEVEAKRQRAEDEIRRLNEDLEHRVADRTTELAIANRELAARNQEVEQANRMKSAFLARMSHELRTPLNAIVGFSDLLAEQTAGPLSDKQKRFVGHVQAGARHLLQVINDILDLSKIDAGRIEIVHEDFYAAEALTEVLSVIRPLAEIKRIRIESGVPPELEVFADRTRFKQILYNLISNAVKFTPEGGSVRVDSTWENGAARFTVADTCIGIPADEHRAIFDEFHQVTASTKGMKEGTGLGLAITRRLVELHGGRIWVESEPANGSCFFFTLPPGAAELARHAEADGR